MDADHEEMSETEAQMQARSKASKILLENELTKRGLTSIDYHCFLWESMGVCLDGYFKLEELEALVAVMKERKAGSLALDSSGLKT